MYTGDLIPRDTHVRPAGTTNINIQVQSYRAHSKTLQSKSILIRKAHDRVKPNFSIKLLLLISIDIHGLNR